MNSLPIVGRELRVAARRRGTYRVRAGVAFLAIVIAGWVLLTRGWRSSAERAAEDIFNSLSVLAFLFCLAAGTRTTADSLSSEKREGTLGLLFLTDLRGYDIVFGKLTATSLGAVYALVAIFPVLALPLLLGGVAPAQFGCMLLVLLNTMFFSLAAGMWVSSVSRQERNAFGGTVGLILLITAGLPAAGALWQEFVLKNSSEPPWPFVLPSPGWAFGVTMESVSNSRYGASFWWSLAAVHGLSWMFLLGAAWIVPRAWQDKNSSASPHSWRDRWRQLHYGGPSARQHRRARLLEVNPVLWLSSRDRLAGLYVLGVLALAAAGWWQGYVHLQREWLEMPFAIMTALCVHAFLKLRLAAEACRRFAEDRQQGALELMLSTPLTVREIVHGALLALRRVFLAPVLIALVADMLMILAALWVTRSSQNSADAMEFFAATCAAGMLVLVADAVTLSWVGLQQGLTAKNYAHACGNTFTVVLVLPWVVFIGSIMMLEATGPLRGVRYSEWFALAYWFGVAIGLDAVLFLLARHTLLKRFREIAARRFTMVQEKRWWQVRRRSSAP